MKKEIGIAQNCTLNSGKIKTQEEEYLFLNTDILENISDGDVVEFHGDQKVKRAYFVKKRYNANRINIEN